MSSRTRGLNRRTVLGSMLAAPFVARQAHAAEMLNAYSIWPENYARPMMEAFEKAIKEEVEKRLSSGASKREVVQWAKQNAFVGKGLSDAVGISLKDIEDDNY